MISTTYLHMIHDLVLEPFDGIKDSQVRSLTGIRINIEVVAVTLSHYALLQTIYEIEKAIPPYQTV